MANKATKDLLILGALGAAAAAGYFYYEKEQEKDIVPEGCQQVIRQIKKESQEKADGKPISTPGGRTETKREDDS